MQDVSIVSQICGWVASVGHFVAKLRISGWADDFELITGPENPGLRFILTLV